MGQEEFWPNLKVGISILLELSVKVLITDGAGYIGGQTWLQLLNSGHEIHVIDNLSNKM